MGAVAVHAGEGVQMRMRCMGATMEPLDDLREVVRVTVRARRGGISKPVWELVESLRVRARVACDTVELRMDAGRPLVPVEDPLVGNSLRRLYVALDTRLGLPGSAGHGHAPSVPLGTRPRVTERRGLERQIAWYVQSNSPKYGGVRLKRSLTRVSSTVSSVRVWSVWHIMHSIWPCWLIEARLGVQHVVRSVTLDAVFDRFRGLPFGRRPAAGEVLVHGQHDGVDDLAAHLGAALLLRLGGYLLTGGQRPLRDRGVAERRHRLYADLPGHLGDVVEPVGREFLFGVPVKQAGRSSAGRSDPYRMQSD